MRRFGLIGRPLGHSASAKYFTEKFRKEGLSDCEYALYELPSVEELPSLLAAMPELCGLNVTIPYKRSVMHLLDRIAPEAQAIGAVNCIRRLPDGYDTVIAEDGGNISQGQKQLLCIARVMLCLPPMLILDEATSSIDTRTEVRIQKAFARMMQGRTSFIVAHRLSTIREADVILVMKDGHIVEQGNHDELLAAGGFYAKLYNSQFEGVET